MRINKILFITLSNIGDVILTLPVLDKLRADFPQAQITVMAGARPREIFQDNPYIHKLIVYDKHARLKEKMRMFRALKKERFDMVVDLRNSFFSVFLSSRRQPSVLSVAPGTRHMKDRHLHKIKAQSHEPRLGRFTGTPYGSLYVSPDDGHYIKNIFKEHRITEHDKIIVVSPGARSHTKRWSKDKFVELISSLVKESGVKVILVGDANDAPINKYIRQHIKEEITDLSERTSIPQLACLLGKAALLITNDSAVLHLASYLDVPVVALFGPTSEVRYGPWSGTGAVVKKDIFCRPCEKAQCRFGTLECLAAIKVEDVLRPVRNILDLNPEAKTQKPKDSFKRILVVRTDRIGDVLLSTPVVRALRDSYPHAYIAMMVSPYSKDIAEGNPDLDEVITYDKDAKHRSWARSVKFALNLKKKRFDLAVILHPTNRAHLVTFFARIRRRIGYNRKMGFLLTDRIEHTKQLGEKHELEYALDLVRHLGIEPQDKSLLMPIKPESEKWTEELFKREEINKNDRLLAIHPGASCPSKIWPNERFAEVADKLAAKYGFKVLVVAGPKDVTLAESIVKHMHSPAVNLAGKTSVSQLASILKRCRLFISNDSGPVHIASAVGTPVISIFGRSQKGLSPVRWGPVGKNDRVAHRTVGCVECLAHNCLRGFICLKAVTADYVLNIADSILQGRDK